MPDRLLDVRRMDVSYGAASAVRGLTLHVDEGEIVALLGANGAGKTSTLRGLSGLVRPRRGTVRFGGQRIDGASPATIVSGGMAHVPEGRRVFPRLSVEENLALGGWNLSRRRAERDEQHELVYTMFPRLVDRRRQLAGSLSGGEQQMLAIGRALMSKPRLLLVDELSLGLAPVFVDELLARLIELHRGGLALLLIEQFVHRALDVADRVYVLDKGSLLFAGSPEDCVASGAVEAAYVGGAVT